MTKYLIVGTIFSVVLAFALAVPQQLKIDRITEIRDCGKVIKTKFHLCAIHHK